MQLRDSPDEAAFRAELRSWLELNAPKEPIARTDVERARAWSRKLYEAGYVGLTWPQEYGGRGLPLTYQAIVLEELARAEAPGHIGVIGLGMAGPTILVHGSEEQKRRYLPKILAADEIWCQGFSEPGAGSDLAAVRTRAELEGGRFVVNGQKVWSSYAHIADWCLLLARSDPESQRHAGLTYLVVDMRAPGVEVRPLRQLTGEAEFNEIFFTDVEVPVENMLGAIGQGWQVAVTTLMHERATLGFALTGALELAVAKLVALARERRLSDARLRDRVAEEWIELQALKLTNARALTTLVETGVPGPEGSVSKLHWSEQNQRLTKLALELAGPESLLAREYAWWRREQLRSRGNTIEAGTSEILRSVIAERVLGLPKSR